MLVEVSPYTEPVSVCTLARGDVVSYSFALKQWFWFSAQTKAWLGQEDAYPCDGRWVLSVDVLPPIARPAEHSRPVFLAEARAGFFSKYEVFGKGELLHFLFRCCFKEATYLNSAVGDNIILLTEQKVAVVHWLPAYGLWQLHIMDDPPYLINPGTRIFALQ